MRRLTYTLEFMLMPLVMLSALVLSGCRASTNTAEWVMAHNEAHDIKNSLKEYMRLKGRLPDTLNAIRVGDDEVNHDKWAYDRSDPDGIILKSRQSYEMGDGRVFFHLNKNGFNVEIVQEN